MKEKTCRTCKHQLIHKFIVDGSNSRTVKHICKMGNPIAHPDINSCGRWKEKGR
jgi:hypothetical protein